MRRKAFTAHLKAAKEQITLCFKRTLNFDWPTAALPNLHRALTIFGRHCCAAPAIEGKGNVTKNKHRPIVTTFDCPILFALYIVGKLRYKWIGVRDVKLNTEN